MLQQNVNSILSIIIVAVIALGASLIIIRVANLDPLSINLSPREIVLGD